jgi:predicted dehydrogenase
LLRCQAQVIVLPRAPFWTLGAVVRLRAFVIGTGWAGEGHTLALQAADVDVVAVCGRKADVAQALASRMGVAEVRLDWRSALSELKPDIVAIATPGGPHREMAEAAAQEGCHIFCDKPMGVNAADARAMLAAARRANVKHAYGATSCLEPVFEVVRTLLADGAVGKLTGIDVQTHMGLSRLLPYSWFHQLSQGGGMLNQIFTHALAQVLFVSGGRPRQVMGEARCLVPQAPLGPTIHDFRQWFSPVPEVNDGTVWRPVDADTEYSAMMHVSLPEGEAVTARFYGSLTAHSRDGGLFALHGTKGTLAIIGGGDAKAILLRDVTRDDWLEVPVPPVAESWWLATDSNEQHNWKAVARRFVADIRGEAQAFYPTFDDGWEASEIIDIVRGGAGWTAIPARSA